MSKVWIQIYNQSSGYSNYPNEPQSKWQLVDVVGEQEIKRPIKQASTSPLTAGAGFEYVRRLLVKTDGGEIYQVWESETFKPFEEKS